MQSRAQMISLTGFASGPGGVKAPQSPPSLRLLPDAAPPGHRRAGRVRLHRLAGLVVRPVVVSVLLPGVVFLGRLLDKRLGIKLAAEQEALDGETRRSSSPHGALRLGAAGQLRHPARVSCWGRRRQIRRCAGRGFAGQSALRLLLVIPKVAATTTTTTTTFDFDGPVHAGVSVKWALSGFSRLRSSARPLVRTDLGGDVSSDLRIARGQPHGPQNTAT